MKIDTLMGILKGLKDRGETDVIAAVWSRSDAVHLSQVDVDNTWWPNLSSYIEDQVDYGPVVDTIRSEIKSADAEE